MTGAGAAAASSVPSAVLRRPQSMANLTEVIKRSGEHSASCWLLLHWGTSYSQVFALY